MTYYSQFFITVVSLLYKNKISDSRGQHWHYASNIKQKLGLVVGKGNLKTSAIDGKRMQPR